MNHQSMIDVMAMLEIWPILRNAAPIAKKSILFMGPFGLCCWLVGCCFIDRKSNSRREDMSHYGKIAKNNGTKLMVFPEGSRNSAGNNSLLPFKKGAFHVALDMKLPILPVVISEYDFLDHKAMRFSPGKVTIKVLPRIETSEYTKDNINDLVTLTENTMRDALRSM
jgi:lysophosphatidate acyltransferase